MTQLPLTAEDKQRAQLRRNHIESRRRLQADITSAVRKGDWEQALMLAGSGSRPTVLKRLWPRLSLEQKPLAMELAVANGDLLHRQRAFLVAALAELKAAGRRVYDSDMARRTFRELPERVRIFRGTVKQEADGHQYGVCWTLKSETARWFASQQERFRRRAAQPAILTATIAREDICGLLIERQESEVVICPADCSDITDGTSLLQEVVYPVCMP
jgi:phage terminase large subunit-like protein